MVVEPSNVAFALTRAHKAMLGALAAACVALPCIAWAADRETGPHDLPCDDPLPLLGQSVFNLAVGTAELREGHACLKVLPEQSGCEWDVGLTRAEKWGPHRQFLLIALHANHLEGPGAWGSVLVYICRRGVYVQTFSERYLYGARVKLGSKSDFWVTAGYWREGDPSCCPSRTRRRHHVWSPRLQRFVIVTTEVQPFN